MSGFDRRAVTAGALSLAGTSLFAPGAARAEPGPVYRRLGLSDPARATDAFVRMRCNVPGQWGVWVYRGQLIVKPEGVVAQALCRIEGISYNRATKRADGGWDYELEEAGYFCDLETGAVLETLANPFTGQSVKVRHYRSPQQLVFDKRTVKPRQTLPPGISFTGVITDPVEIGDRMFASEDLYVSTPPRPAEGDRPARPARTQTSLAMFDVRAADLLRPNAWVPATAHYGTINGFVDWLGMAGMPGVQSMRLVMTKGRDARFAPAWLKERVRADHPNFFDGRPA
jgi:hypothetical protein